MNNTLTIEDGVGNTVYVPDFIRENVLDLKGYQCTTECPCCGRQAKERIFDECLGGAINTVYRIDCSHCAHHECDQDFCGSCEAAFETGFSRNVKRWKMAEKVDLMLDHLVDTLATQKYVKASVITEMKLMLSSESELSALFNQIFVSRGVSNRRHIQRQLLDAKFNRNLEEKIKQPFIQQGESRGLVL